MFHILYTLLVHVRVPNRTTGTVPPAAAPRPAAGTHDTAVTAASKRDGGSPRFHRPPWTRQDPEYMMIRASPGMLDA